jgi:hypothetical protein
MTGSRKVERDEDVAMGIESRCLSISRWREVHRDPEPWMHSPTKKPEIVIQIKVQSNRYPSAALAKSRARKHPFVVNCGARGVPAAECWWRDKPSRGHRTRRLHKGSSCVPVAPGKRTVASWHMAAMTVLRPILSREQADTDSHGRSSRRFWKRRAAFHSPVH